MLSPDIRQTLLDALRPPAGFRLGCAVGTTYSLNLDAALTAPASFALYAVTDLREPRRVEPLELLDSIRRHADRFTIFFQAGQVAVPVQRRLFAYLEGAVIPVAAPNGGVFHPKIWVLRFDADDAPSSFRMLCASRNLTHDRSWDTILRLDSADDQDAEPSIEPVGLAAMVRALPGLVVGQISAQRQADIAALSDQLEVVRWAPPSGVRSGRFLPIGISDSSPPPFPPTADRIAVVSPFLSAGLLKRLPNSTGRRVLVSRPDQITSCAATIAARFGEVYTLDPDAVPSGATDEGAGAGDSGQVPAEDPTIPFEGLHAKLFVFDHGSDTTVLTGSANATNAAFGTNVEFLTELTGPRSAVGVEALLAEPAKDVQTLRSFLIPFPLTEADDESDAADAIEDELDMLRREIAGMAFEARARPDGSGDRFRLSFTSAEAIPPLPGGVVWRTWPTTVTADTSHEVDPTGEFDELFAVSFEGITAFFANELTLGDVSTRFVLTADLVEAPANRATRLLRILLGDAERFLRYLLMLLADDAVDRYGLSDMLDALDNNSDGYWQTAQDNVPLLEALLRTLSRDPSRLDHIQHLITDLRADPEGESLLPPGLMEIWEPIWAVASEQRR